jgi:hypothetical protein
MVDGVRVLGVLRLPPGAPGGMASVAAADVDISGPAADMEGIHGFLGRETIPFLKKTKSGMKEADLRAQVYSYGWGGDGTLSLRLAAGGGGNLKPENLLAAYFESTGRPFERHRFRIVRKELYSLDGASNYIALGDMGEEFG